MTDQSSPITPPYSRETFREKERLGGTTSVSTEYHKDAREKEKAYLLPNAAVPVLYASAGKDTHCEAYGKDGKNQLRSAIAGREGEGQRGELTRATGGPNEASP
jgi:hypothetical protein